MPGAGTVAQGRFLGDAGAPSGFEYGVGRDVNEPPVSA
jgi:hypothetical protein